MRLHEVDDDAAAERIEVVQAQDGDRVLLDEAVSVFEEAEARELYRMLFDKLPGAAIISVGRSSVLAGLHRRTFEMSGSPRAARDANLRTLSAAPA